MCRAFLLQARALFENGATEKLSKHIQCQIASLEKEQPHKVNAHAVFFGEFANDTKGILSPNMPLTEEASQWAMRNHGAAWESLSEAEKSSYERMAATRVAAAQQSIIDVIAHLKTILSLDQARDMEETLGRGMITRVGECRFSP